MALQNFDKSREAMVVSQLQPSGIVAEDVLNAFREIPREMFIPNSLRGASYLDDDINMGGGRVLLEPLILALMVQDAKLKKSDKVLDIGGGTGYFAAILSKFVEQVFVVDMNEQLLQHACGHWQQLELLNKINAIIGNHIDGYVKGAPYDVIFINGAVANIPDNLLNQLAINGRIYFVKQDAELESGVLTVIIKQESGVLLTKQLNNVTTSYLKGFEPLSDFVF